MNAEFFQKAQRDFLETIDEQMADNEKIRNGEKITALEIAFSVLMCGVIVWKVGFQEPLRVVFCCLLCAFAGYWCWSDMRMMRDSELFSFELMDFRRRTEQANDLDELDEIIGEGVLCFDARATRELIDMALTICGILTLLTLYFYFL